MKRTTLLMATLLALALSTGASSKPASPQDLLRSVQVYTRGDSILDESSRSDLLAILREMQNSPEREFLLTVSLELTDKVVRDYAHLQFLYLDLHKLSANAYAQEAGRISPTHFDPIGTELKDLHQQMIQARPAFHHPDTVLSTAEIDTIIAGHKVFFQDEAPASSHKVKSRLLSLLQEPRRGWNKRYDSLVAQLKTAPDSSSEDVLTSEEYKFIKIYGRIRTYLDSI
jgi:hypothetical protein